MIGLPDLAALAAFFVLGFALGLGRGRREGKTAALCYQADVVRAGPRDAPQSPYRLVASRHVVEAIRDAQEPLTAVYVRGAPPQPGEVFQAVAVRPSDTPCGARGPHLGPCPEACNPRGVIAVRNPTLATKAVRS